MSYELRRNNLELKTQNSKLRNAQSGGNVMARSTSTAGQAGAAAVIRQQGANRAKRSLYTIVAAYTGPAMIGIFIFSVIPILYTLFTSFTNRNTFHFPAAADLFGPTRPGAYTFIGLQNYGTLFWDSTTKTFNVDIFSVL